MTITFLQLFEHENQRPMWPSHRAVCGQAVTYEEERRRKSLGRRRSVEIINRMNVDEEEKRPKDWLLTEKSGKWWEGGDFLIVQWLRLYLPMQSMLVGSLVQELRSHMPPGWKYIYIKQNNKFNKEFKNGPHLKTKILKTERNNDKKPAKNTVTDIA